MASQYTLAEVNVHLLGGSVDWDDLYQTVKTPVRYWVYAHRVPSWVGQEEDIINDIVQETILRVWTYLRKGEQGQVVPVKSLPGFCRTVALNYGRDLQRHDSHLVHTDSSQGWEYIVVCGMVEDVAVEHMSQNEWFLFLAAVIKDFPDKQREAVLTDLACRTDFYGPPTVLEQAFLQVGIQLKDYQQPPPADAAGRNRYLSLLSTAYKRLRSMLSKLGGEIPPKVSDQQMTSILSVQQKRSGRQDSQSDSRKMSAQTFMFSRAASSLRVEKISSREIVKMKKPSAEQKARHEALTREMKNMANPKKGEERVFEEPSETGAPSGSDLATLALHLRQAPVIDPAYREELRSKLADKVRAGGQEGEQSRDMNDLEADREGSFRSNASNNEDIDDIGGIGNDAELAILAEHLRRTAPPTTIDRSFRESLRRKLLDIGREQRPSESTSQETGRPLIRSASC